MSEELITQVTKIIADYYIFLSVSFFSFIVTCILILALIGFEIFRLVKTTNFVKFYKATLNEGQLKAIEGYKKII